MTTKLKGRVMRLEQLEMLNLSLILALFRSKSLRQFNVLILLQTNIKHLTLFKSAQLSEPREIYQAHKRMYIDKIYSITFIQ